ncbi:MAG: hypothetical protein HYX90_06005 [Chloroflexi bacterium]|nr:hypothetical protein [Chloroflexota bacterium]
MKTTKLWALSAFLCLLMVSLMACATSTTPGQNTTPAASPAGTTSSPTPKATASAGQVSFAGKTITIILSSNPGGGSDTIARIYAKFLGQYLPGKPSVIVRSMPGGAHLIGTNYAYRAKPDGLTLYTGSGPAKTNQIFGVKGVEYDLTKMTAFVASAGSYLFYLGSGVVDKPENVLNAKGLVWGYSSAPGSPTGMILCAQDFLKLPITKFVFAYESAADSRRAVLSGEINFTAGATPGLVSSGGVAGDIMPLFHTGVVDDKGKVVRDPVVPNVMTLEELHRALYGKPVPNGPAYQTYNAISAAISGFQYSLHLPPKTPEDIIRAYIEASRKMVQDQAFKKSASSLTEADFLVGLEVDKAFKELMAVQPDQLEWFKKLAESKGLTF